jgi:hypothetical protein
VVGGVVIWPAARVVETVDADHVELRVPHLADDQHAQDHQEPVTDQAGDRHPSVRRTTAGRGWQCPSGGRQRLVTIQTAISLNCHRRLTRHLGRASASNGTSHSEYCGLHTFVVSRNAATHQETPAGPRAA